MIASLHKCLRVIVVTIAIVGTLAVVVVPPVLLLFLLAHALPSRHCVTEHDHCAVAGRNREHVTPGVAHRGIACVHCQGFRSAMLRSERVSFAVPMCSPGDFLLTSALCMSLCFWASLCVRMYHSRGIKLVALCVYDGICLNMPMRSGVCVRVM